MSIKIGTIEYVINDESFEVDNVNITSQNYHEEPSGGYKEPNDTVETVKFEADTEHGKITGEATARRSGFNTYFEFEDIDINIDNKKVEISIPECTIEEDEE
jgi:hypothetical protein